VDVVASLPVIDAVELDGLAGIDDLDAHEGCGSPLPAAKFDEHGTVAS